MRYIVKDLYGNRYAVMDTEKNNEKICICGKKINALNIAFAMSVMKNLPKEVV